MSPPDPASVYHIQFQQVRLLISEFTTTAVFAIASVVFLAKKLRAAVREISRMFQGKWR